MRFANEDFFPQLHMDLFYRVFTVQQESCLNSKTQRLVGMGALKSKHTQMKNIF